MRPVVLITGASSGIGESTAFIFAKNGYDLALNYFKGYERIQKIKEQIESAYSVSVLLLEGDVSKEENVKRIVDETIKEFGQIDVLINNAGISIDTELEDKSVEDFKRIVDVNLIGPFLMSKYIGPYMLERKKGSIVNVSSTNGIDTFYPMSLDYDASKAGLISLTHNFALSYAPYIRVNAVAPGWVKSNMTKEIFPQFIVEETEKIFLKRFAEPEEIAEAIYFLASEKASYITGEVLRIDGGTYHS